MKHTINNNETYKISTINIISILGLILTHIQELAQQLYTNENPNPQPYVQKILKPPEGAFARIHQPLLPRINPEQVQAIIDEGLAKNNLKVRFVLKLYFYILYFI